MAKLEYTPGPWIVENQKDGRIEQQGTTETICVVYPEDYTTKLIAAAPEMYELLCKISVEPIPTGGTSAGIINAVRELVERIETT